MSTTEKIKTARKKFNMCSKTVITNNNCDFSEVRMNTFFFSFFKTTYGIVFTIILAILFLCVDISYSFKKDLILSNNVILFIDISLIFIIGVCYYWLKSKKTVLSKTYININIDRLILVTTGILFLGQLYVFHNIFFLSGWDVSYVRDFVETFLYNRDLEKVNFYYSRYPNNLLISYIFLFIQKTNQYFGIFNNDYTFFPLVIFNCAINSLSCWLSYKTAKLFTSSYWAIFAYIFCVFSIGISGWTVIAYSDAFSLFFPILSVYLYCKHYKHPQTKIAGLIFASIVSAIGYFIKPQCLFVLIGILILEVLKLFSKPSLKALLRPLVLSLVAVLVFSSVNFSLTFFNQKYNIQIDNEQKFGISHFLMMGANQETNGVFSGPDNDFSASFTNSEERNNANINVFIERITTMKFNFVTHLAKKMLTTFNDGTFAWGDEGTFISIVPADVNIKMAPFLKSIYYFGHNYLYFATFQHIIWIFVLLGALLTVTTKKNNCEHHKITLIWITLLGFVLYEMFFEVRARYVYIFVPLFCILVPIGLKNISLIMSDFTDCIKKRIERTKNK